MYARCALTPFTMKLLIGDSINQSPNQSINQSICPGPSQHPVFIDALLCEDMIISKSGFLDTLGIKIMWQLF